MAAGDNLTTGVTDTASGISNTASQVNENYIDSWQYGGGRKPQPGDIDFVGQDFWEKLDFLHLFTDSPQTKYNRALAEWQAKDLADRDKKWYEYMSNTAVRRRMADLKAAGINPLLAGNIAANSGVIGSGLPAATVNSETRRDTARTIAGIGLLAALAKIFL